ncbi:hypothetical protein GQ55_5G536800 [Panicum hallii var. hallii]|uniref:DUF1618 domain-containing protein n=1 Tax=Panicum hallii var. hallii TaxID=1504633 RepID=A0A2T7DT85_9POAL|nr:hypothetical protein GQ55_5G536800 [Panicum hallii var. hallii]
MAAASSSPSSTSSAPARWGIPATIHRVCAADADLPPGHADLSLALAAPPAISILTVPPRVSPDTVSSRNYPSVLAVDPSGLLLHATQGERTGPILRRDRLSSNNFVCYRRHFVHAYFLCDARSANAHRLPDPDDNRILDAGNLGLLTRDGGCTYLLAELQPVRSWLRHRDPAVLFFRDTAVDSKALDYPLRVVRPWASHGVFSLGERLWWCDVSWGLLTCLPFEEEPVLEFVQLPVSDRLSFQCTGKELQGYGCFAVTNGAVRFVKIGVPNRPKVTVERVKKMVRRHGQGHDPWITMYMLCSDERSGSWSWRIEHEVSFKDIWCHQTYEASGLPKKCPKLACVDPFDPDNVYFFLQGFIFSLDLSSWSLQKHARFNVKKPTRKHMSSRFVLACELPVTPS